MRPFLDLTAAYQFKKESIDEAVNKVLRSGNYVLGEQVASFEAEWAEFCGSRYAVGVGNGLDALTLTLMGLGIGAGDEVIVPSFTFVATWLAVSQVGAKPVPVDCDQNTFNIDPTLIESAITNATRAIIPVHLFGQSADLQPVNELARLHKLSVIEDAAQAHGALYEGKRIGGHGNTACWSFYPGKNLGAAGDAGAITTDCGELYDKLLKLRNYGSEAKYHHEYLGKNSRLDEIQAAILRVKLEDLEICNQKRTEIAEYYSAHLAETEVRTPTIHGLAKSCWHQYVIRSSKRDELIAHMQHRGISTLMHYPIPPHRQSIYSATKFSRRSICVAEAMSKQVLSLPMDPFSPLQAAENVVEAVKSFNGC